MATRAPGVRRSDREEGGTTGAEAASRCRSASATTVRIPRRRVAPTTTRRSARRRTVDRGFERAQERVDQNGRAGPGRLFPPPVLGRGPGRHGAWLPVRRGRSAGPARGWRPGRRGGRCRGGRGVVGGAVGRCGAGWSRPDRVDGAGRSRPDRGSGASHGGGRSCGAVGTATPGWPGGDRRRPRPGGSRWRGVGRGARHTRTPGRCSPGTGNPRHGRRRLGVWRRSPRGRTGGRRADRSRHGSPRRAPRHTRSGPTHAGRSGVAVLGRRP